MSISLLVFLAVYVGGLLAALFRQPVFGLYTYVLVFYLHPPARWWAADLPDLRWSLVAAAVTVASTLLFHRGTNRASWLSARPAWLLLAVTLWLWIQTAWAMNPEPHQEAAILFSKYLVLFYLIYRLIETEVDLRNFLIAHIFGCFYLGWLAYDTPTAASGRLEGVGGPGIDEANALSMQLATGVLCASMLLLTLRHWTKWALVVALAFMLNGIVLSGSRSSFLALLMGGLILTVFKPRTHRKVYYTYAAMALVLFAALASQFFWERMGTMKAAVDEQEELDGSAGSRFYIADAQWRIFLDHPFGIGHRGTELLTPAYSHEEFQKGRAGRASHNTFMTMLTEQGFVGAAIFLLILIWAIRSLSYLRARYTHFTPTQHGQIAAIAASLTCVAVAGLFVDYFKSEVQIWLLALLAARVSVAMGAEVRASAARPLTAGKITMNASRVAKSGPLAR